MYLNTKCLSPHRSTGRHATRSGSLHGWSSSSGIHVWRASLPSGISSSVPIIPGRGSARGYPSRGWSPRRRASVGGRTATRLASVWRFVHIMWRTSTVSLRAYIPNNSFEENISWSINIAHMGFMQIYWKQIMHSVLSC